MKNIFVFLLIVMSVFAIDIAISEYTGQQSQQCVTEDQDGWCMWEGNMRYWNSDAE